MIFDVISSGSKGNATLVIYKDTCLLIDFGISKKRVVSALNSYGLGFDDIDAFLITHSHSDHASNVYSAPVNKIFSSALKLPKDVEIDVSHFLRPNITFKIKDIVIKTIQLSHDAKNTLGFIIEGGDEKLVYITDTGFIPEKYFADLRGATYYILESNHDPKMLYESSRPDYLVKRIVSDQGHLSNTDCAYYLSIFIDSNTKEVVLAHLSEECNTKEIALATYEKVMMTQLSYLPDCLVKVASATEETKGGSSR